MDQQTKQNLIPLPDDSLPSYDGAKLPSVQPKDQYSDTNPTNTEDDWMPSPFVSNCQPGLEYLTRIDKFFFNQSLEHTENKNKYLVKNDLYQNVYTAVEEYSKCCFICCNKTRPFDISVFDFQEREVIRLERSLKCQSCCFPCCLQSVKVTASGTLCGFIKQSWSMFKPKFRICDASGNTVLLIEGPVGANYAGPKFKVLLKDGKTEVGYVSKLLPALVRNSLPKANHFSISFPMDLDVNIKAVLLAASILIDLLYYKTALRASRNVQEAVHVGFELGHCLAMCLLH